MLNDRYAKTGQFIGEFNGKYSDEPGPTSPVES